MRRTKRFQIGDVVLIERPKGKSGQCLSFHAEITGEEYDRPNGRITRFQLRRRVYGRQGPRLIGPILIKRRGEIHSLVARNGIPA